MTVDELKQYRATYSVPIEHFATVDGSATTTNQRPEDTKPTTGRRTMPIVVASSMESSLSDHPLSTATTTTNTKNSLSTITANNMPATTKPNGMLSESSADNSVLIFALIGAAGFVVVVTVIAVTVWYVKTEDKSTETAVEMDETG